MSQSERRSPSEAAGDNARKRIGPPRSRKIEWAVVGDQGVYKDGLGSREEAEAWLQALAMTHEREASDRFYTKDAHTVRDEMAVVWRERVWHSGDPEATS